ncbi:hypothetical protein N781_17525 [Pontibacillus halophilus JSM 076056 = DSM 19796]|uniref:Glutamate-rich protein GrpB n=1 Tax=Pontibacillus halophilus JSM 076056 = DSM 19796 TaxID=1385510 RepID=A0A0A5GLT1_9BACI|nr:GrpB family protein [Pontibacillus halophilus]KGX92110.1 hypothetical protein N781_17525 [Pontibacillus halophilus JSM 076056 = DSM 19796]
MFGLPKDEVYLHPWSGSWEEEYHHEKKKIEQQLPVDSIKIHHIGSTAVKQLSSMPIIDIAIEVPNYEAGMTCIASLEEIGYVYEGENVYPERHYFIKGSPVTHEIHLFEAGSEHLEAQLKFRDFLNQDARARSEYERLKLNLSVANKQDKRRYVDEKTAFIEDVLKKLN